METYSTRDRRYIRPERILRWHVATVSTRGCPERIHVARAYNSAHQMLLAEEIKRMSRGINVKMIIVDSLTSHFVEFVGRGMLANRQQKLNRHLKDLKQLADVNNALVLVTNRYRASLMQCGRPNRPIGGHVLAHASTFRLYLRKAKGGQKSLA